MRLLPLIGRRRRRIFDRIAIVGGAGLLAAPATPTLTWVTGSTDNTPQLLLDGALVEGDTVRENHSLSSDFSSGVFESTNTVDAAEDAANELDFTGIGALADGTWYVRMRIERPGHASSAWSNTETKTIDTTAPTLSSPTGTKTGSTTASGTVDTNEANGTLYRVTDTGSAPSAAQVKAGQGSGGSAANGQAANAAVVATGTQTLNATGLTAATTYKHYWMQEDAVGNQSNVSASASFTTDAGAGAVTVNATGTKLYTGAAGTSINYTGLTVAAGSNTAIVGLLFVDSATNISGVTATWDSGGAAQAMTQIIEKDAGAGNDAVYIFALAGEHGAVATGNKTLTVSWTGSQKTFFVAMAFDGVNQTGGVTSFPNATSATTPTVPVTSAVGNKVIALESSGSAQGTSTGTLIFDDHANGSVINAMCQYADGAASVVIGNNGTNVSIAATDIKAA